MPSMEKEKNSVKLTPDILSASVPLILNKMAEKGFPCNMEMAIWIAAECYKALGVESPKSLTVKDLFFMSNCEASKEFESYFDLYHSLFSPLRNELISLMEIGGRNGSSLEVWEKYFQNASLIVGCDIDQMYKNTYCASDIIKIISGDVNLNQVMADIKNITQSFDIIIDCGSRICSDIVSSFLNYFPLLKPGGLYIVEDVHALYGRVAGGDALSKLSVHEFFKICADIPSIEAWRDNIAPAVLFSSFIPSDFPAWLAEGSIESVEFRTSVVIIRKCA